MSWVSVAFLIVTLFLYDFRSTSSIKNRNKSDMLTVIKKINIPNSCNTHNKKETKLDSIGRFNILKNVISFLVK